MRRQLIIPLIAAISWLPSATPAAAQALLRWKLQPGESFVVRTEQQTESQVAFSGQSVTTKIELAVTLLWSVASAEKNGLSIDQTLERIELKLESPTVGTVQTIGTVQYDSASAARPSGQARVIADTLKPLIGATVTTIMSEQGEISEAKPKNSAAQTLFKTQGEEQQATGSSRSAVEKLLRQPLLVLPEKPVSEGDSWTRKAELVTAAGSFQQTMTYRLAGAIDREGQPLLKIESSSQLQPAAAGQQAKKLAVKSHEQSGTILFSADSGRIVEAEQSQKLTTERPYRDTTIVVKLASTQKTTLKPAAKEQASAAGSPVAGP